MRVVVSAGDREPEKGLTGISASRCRSGRAAAAVLLELWECLFTSLMSRSIQTLANYGGYVDIPVRSYPYPNLYKEYKKCNPSYRNVQRCWWSHLEAFLLQHAVLASLLRPQGSIHAHGPVQFLIPA